MQHSIKVPAHDPKTLAFYDQEAEAYAGEPWGPSRQLGGFLNRLQPGARILELGTGSGRDAEVMIAAGFEVEPTDGSPGLIAQAEKRLGRPVRLMLFEQLDEAGAYDAVWASASLLHTPMPALASVLGRVHRALKPGGLFYASYKAGKRAGRDRLGRYYNFTTPERLRRAYERAGDWESLEITRSPGGGYDGVPRVALNCLASTPR